MEKTYSFILCLLFVHVCNAQRNMRGHVIGENSQPLAGAMVQANKKNLTLVTDSAGFFSMPVSATPLIVSISHVGYVPRRISITDTLDMVIQLQRDTTLLEEAIVRSFERNGTPRDLAASVTILSRQALDRFSGTSFVAAVNTVPGVKMDERSPGSYRLSIRGNLLRSTFGIRNVKVYWNGIPFTDASGNTYINLLPSSILQGMEILRGPSGSMYGSGTGGVMLLQSNAGSQERGKEVAMQLSAGSYGLLSANVSYSFKGPNNAAITYAHQQADGYRQHSQMHRDALHYAGTLTLNNQHKLYANVLAARLFYETPGALTALEMKNNPRAARPAAGIFQAAATQKAAVDLKKIYAGVALQSRFSSSWSSTTSVFASYTDFQNPTIRNYENKYDRGAGFRTLVQHKLGVFKTIAGAEYQSGFFYAAVHGNRRGVKDTLQFQDDVKSTQVNVFLQTDIDLSGGFVLSGGLSYNSFVYGFERTRAVPQKNISHSFDPEFVPRLSLLKKFQRFNIYTAVSKGYSVPSIDEIHAGNDVFNTSLKSEIAWNYEAGIKAEIIPRRLWLDVAYYILQLQNTIVSRRNASGGDFYTNAGKTRQRGIESALKYEAVRRVGAFLSQLNVTAAFTNVHARFRNYQQGAASFDGNKLTGTAPNIFSIGLDIQTAKKLSLNLNYNFTDHLPLTDANTAWANSYQLISARLNYPIQLHTTLNALVFASSESALVNPYSLGNDLNAAGGRFFNPSTPQQFTIGVQCAYKIKSRRTTLL